MHTSPTSQETTLYLNSGRRSYYIFGITSTLSLLTGLFLFSISSPMFYWFGLLTLLVSFYLLLSLYIGIFGTKPSLLLTDIQETDFPEVDVYLPCCGEDLEVIENTYRSVSKLKYPKDKLNIYILNDTKDPAYCAEIKKLSEKYEFGLFERPNKGELKKAGNLRYAFSQTYGKYFLILDADFCPHEDILLLTVTDMEKNESVAVLQTPQFFSIEIYQTWVEKGAGFIQELFYRLIQVSRNTWGAAICVGTNALYRREALEPFGGTAEIGYSEDVHTGFMLVNNGWNLKYVPHILAKGNCPGTPSAFFVQQYRWATGSVSLFLNKSFWKSRLTLIQKSCYLSGMLYYILTGIGLFTIQLPSMLLIALAPDKILWYNVFFSLPSFLFGILFVRLWSKANWGWYAVKARQLSYYAHFCAILDKSRGKLIPWQASGAVKVSDRYVRFCSFMRYWIYSKTIFILGMIVFHSSNYSVYNFFPLIFFTLLDFVINYQVLSDTK